MCHHGVLHIGVSPAQRSAVERPYAIASFRMRAWPRQPARRPLHFSPRRWPVTTAKSLRCVEKCSQLRRQLRRHRRALIYHRLHRSGRNAKPLSKRCRIGLQRYQELLPENLAQVDRRHTVFDHCDSPAAGWSGQYAANEPRRGGRLVEGCWRITRCRPGEASAAPAASRWCLGPHPRCWS